MWRWMLFSLRVTCTEEEIHWGFSWGLVNEAVSNLRFSSTSKPRIGMANFELGVLDSWEIEELGDSLEACRDSRLLDEILVSSESKDWEFTS
jgi:hypothetical protein